tara:strand:+ start:68769 stop:69242 length:474 start_codon:yes stop_codon:yes gene_type:complete
MKLLAICISILLSSVLFAHPHSKDSISFDYRIKNSVNMKGVYLVNATILNNSSETFYFLSESCNGLNYYITATSPKVITYIVINCNGTAPIKNSIAPKGVYDFTFRIKTAGDVSRVGLNLALVKLSKNYSVKNKSAGSIRKKLHVLTLSGPVLPLPH